jgi:FAD/FMN-containing dehydrogenase
MLLTPPLLELDGRVLLPGADGYDEARRLWNAAIDRRPAVIAQCSSATDVAAAVSCACASGLRIAIRGGGHSTAGHSVVDGGLMIDLSPMKEVAVDPVERVATVQPGVLLGELDRATQEHGLAVPAGTISHTGVAGLTLGGGIGWLMRKYGLTIDNLLEVEIVIADGGIVRASEHENADLFWAVRGAGANFGVVTEFVFRLHPVGTILGGPMLYPYRDAAALFKGARDVLAEAPDELNTALVLLTVPPHPPFPEELWGQKAAAITVAYSGELETGAHVVDRLRGLAAPALDLVAPMPYVALQSMLDDTAPHGLHHYNTAETLPALGDDSVDAIVAAFADVPSPRSHVIVSHLGGAIGRVPQAATAFAQRDGAYLAWVLSIWEPGAVAEPHVAWGRRTKAALEPFGSGGTYVNSLEPDVRTIGRLRASYGDNWPRLVELKRRYDPENVFRLNQNIRPDVAVT